MVALALVSLTDAQASLWYRDADGDGYGRSSGAVEADTAPDGYVPTGDDCDDNNAARHPGATELCGDGLDNDCDGFEGANDPLSLPLWYVDGDADGYGDPSSSTLRGCDAPTGRVSNNLDCNDTQATIHPGAEESCDGVDQDCNTLIDDEPTLAPVWFEDADGDGFGNPIGLQVHACDKPLGYSAVVGDCDDTSTLFHPRAFEACSPPLADTNCDGSVGEADNDGDGTKACEDCDDRDPDVYPGAYDIWYDGVIWDCDHASDFDQDLDGVDALDHGGTDCDDKDPNAYPGAADNLGDGVDQDCNGVDGLDGGDTDDGVVVVKPKDDCGCASGGGAATSLALLPWIALLRRRRR